MAGLGQPGTQSVGAHGSTSQVSTAASGPTQAQIAQDSANDVDPITFFGEDVPTLLWDTQSKTYFINPEKTSVKWEYETGQLNNVFPFNVAANSQVKFTVRINPETGLRGDTEIGAAMLTSTGRCAVQIFVPLLNKYLSNNLISTNLMFGTAQLQAMLAQTIYSLPSFDWSVDCLDLSGVQNTISPVWFARRFVDSGTSRIQASRRAVGMSRFMHAYWLGPTTAFNNTSNSPIPVAPTIVIPGNSTCTFTYSVPSDAYFDWKWTLDDSDLGGAAVGSVLTAQITEGGSGRSLVDVPQGNNGISWQDFLATPTSAVAGFPSGGGALVTGGVRAASLPSPTGCWSHLLSPGCDLTIVFANASSTAVNSRTALAGVAIYVDPTTGGCPS